MKLKVHLQIYFREVSTLKRTTVTLLFLVFNCVVFSTLVFPPFFKYFNRIDPWVLGLPFSQFWIIVVVILVSSSLIVWYLVESIRGELE